MPTASPIPGLRHRKRAFAFYRIDERVELGTQDVDCGVAYPLWLLAGRSQDQGHLIQHLGGALGSEDVNAPVEWGCPHRCQRARHAVDEVQRHYCGVEGRRTLLTRELS